MLRVFTVFALALCFGLGTAYAQDGQTKKNEGQQRQRMSVEDRFKSKDKDQDGKLTLDEFLGNAKDNKEHPDLAKRLEERFKAMDTNKDGVVTLEEMKAYWQKQAQEMAKHRVRGRRQWHTQQSTTQT